MSARAVNERLNSVATFLGTAFFLARLWVSPLRCGPLSPPCYIRVDPLSRYEPRNIVAAFVDSVEWSDLVRIRMRCLRNGMKEETEEIVYKYILYSIESKEVSLTRRSYSLRFYPSALSYCF